MKEFDDSGVYDMYGSLEVIVHLCIECVNKSNITKIALF
jgi:hypothetical protein